MPDRRRQRGAGLRRGRARTEVAGQQRHRVADRHHLAEQRLPQRGGWHRARRQIRTRHGHRSRAVNRHRRDDHGGVLTKARVGQCHVVEQCGARRCVGSGQADHRGRGARAGQRNRVPFPDAQGCNGFGVQADHSTARVRCRGVQPGGERKLTHGWPPGRRSRSLAADRRAAAARLPGCARRMARRACRCCLGLSSHTSGCAASHALLRTANGMWQT